MHWENARANMLGPSIRVGRYTCNFVPAIWLASEVLFLALSMMVSATRANQKRPFVQFNFFYFFNLTLYMVLPIEVTTLNAAFQTKSALRSRGSDLTRTITILEYLNRFPDGLS